MRRAAERAERARLALEDAERERLAAAERAARAAAELAEAGGGRLPSRPVCRRAPVLHSQLTAGCRQLTRMRHAYREPSSRMSESNEGATMTPDPSRTADSRADLHCHSTASQVSKLGVQRRAGLPECATPPEEVYELAKRRGMDFVTITDHDTIDGVLDDRRSARRLHLGGADRLLPRRAAGRARALLRNHARRSRVASGSLRERRGMRRVPARQRDRMRARPPLLRRRRAARAAPPAPARRAVRDLGDPERLAGP